MWQRIKEGFRNFMVGRHGTDMLSIALTRAGIVLYLVSIILSLIRTTATAVIGSILGYIGLACLIYSLVRSLSRNNAKREDQNRRYLALRDRFRTEMRQAKVRYQNRDKYKYFRCPGCKTWIRLPRGSGVVTVTCSKCKNSFTQKG